MNTKIKILIMLAVFTAIATGSVYATPSFPCLIKVHQGESIQAAIDAVYGDTCTIWIAPGIYQEDLDISYDINNDPYQRKNLKIVGASMDSTIIQGQILVAEFACYYASPCRSVEIENITIDGEKQRQTALTVRSSYLKTKMVRIHGFNQGIVPWLDSIVEIRNTVIDHNQTGIANYVSSGNTVFHVINSTFAYNSVRGIFLDHDVTRVNGPPTNIINTIFYRNGIGLDVHNGCILSDWAPFAKYNDFYQNSLDVGCGRPGQIGRTFGDPATNINADPTFVSPKVGNYHLRRGSPCINAGDPLSPRDSDGTRADMGALPYYSRLERL